MASPLTNPICKQFVGLGISYLRQELHTLNATRENAERMRNMLIILRSKLKEAYEKHLHRSPTLREHLENIQGVVYDAEDTLEIREADEKVLMDFQGSHYIKEMLDKMEKIDGETNFIVGLNLNAGTCVSRKTTFRVGESDVIIGREKEKDEIVAQLLSEECNRSEGGPSVLPIVGMAGVGKTTLAQLVYNDDKIKSRFQNATMWVSVTDKFDFNMILKDMMGCLDPEMKDLETSTEIQLESRLVKFLEGKRFLLVLDDVWSLDRDSWGKLESILINGAVGSKVLITSRNTRVSHVVRGALPPYYLNGLSEEHGWSTLAKIAFNQDNNLRGSVPKPDSKLETVGREIVRKCNGLPLAIAKMGEILRGNTDVAKWDCILKQKIWEAEKGRANCGQPVILPVLQLSYDHLPFHLKQCFAYCYTFPKAHFFCKMELLKFWKAVSLIQPNGPESLDETGSDYFEELLSRSLFQLSKDMGNYKMHDLIHDLAQSVSRPFCLQVIENEAYDTSEKVRHLSLLCTDPQQPMQEALRSCKKLRTLISPRCCTSVTSLKNFKETLKNIFNTLEYLRVLDLSSSPIVDLPKGLEKLKLLRYLNLSGTQVRRIPSSVCKLYHLQTLKLRNCPKLLCELPKDLGNLTNLQHLELDDIFWNNLKSLPPRVGRLTKLQNLHAFPVSRDQRSGCGVDELKDMDHLEGTLHFSKLENAGNAAEGANLKAKERLVKVVYEWSNRLGNLQVAEDEKTLEELQPHSNVKEIEIHNYQGRIPSWLSNYSHLMINVINCPRLVRNLPPHLHKSMAGICIEGCSDLKCTAFMQHHAYS